MKLRPRMLWLLSATLSLQVTAPLAQPQSFPPKSKHDYRRHALSHEGDPQRGRDLFFDPQRTACSQCHSVDATRSTAGPDLSAIGDKFGRRELIDAVLEPSRELANGYETTVVQTVSGEEYTGILKQAGPGWIQLIRADGSEVRFTDDEIEARNTSTISLMPEELHSALALSDFADLIAYLTSLKQPENLQAEHQGMPHPIPELARPIVLEPIHSEAFAFHQPVWFGPVPGLPGAFLVLEHERGKIWLFEKRREGDRKALFLDLGDNITAGGSRGLLGCAFHPNFTENRKYYLAIHIVENRQPWCNTIELIAAPDLRKDSGRPPRTVLQIKAATNVHYGGGLRFGPDGFLYIGMGDTGPQDDPNGHGQNPQLLLGKLMRIDVDRCDPGLPYAIPHDNPFAQSAAVRPEIWALGFREPWRFSFDPLTRKLWVGDVGQNLFEEITIVHRGENHGWNVYEGFEPFSNVYRKPGENYVPPVFAYGRRYGVSVTGGYVYRADPRSSFYGVYICGDYQSRRIWGLTQSNRILKTIRQIGISPQRIVSFGIDWEGNHYLVGYEGTIYRMHLGETVFE